MTTREPAVQFIEVSKNYGDFAALTDVSFDVPHGEVTALLGPNGAGKSSLIDILGGVLSPTTGEAKVLGRTVHGPGTLPPGTMGIMLQDAGFIPELTVAQTVRSWSAFHRNPAGDVLERVGLADRAGTRVGTLSGGEKRRLELALAVMGPPEIIVLDEPTTGMDVDSRAQAVALIGDLTDRGATVILTTHLLEEAQELADSVVILRNGSVQLQQRVADQTGTETHIQFTVRAGDWQELADRLPDVTISANRTPSYSSPDELSLATIVTATPQAVLYRLLGAAHEIDAPLGSLRVRPQTIEDLYFAATLKDSEPSWSR